jgi:hypothetical protein
MNRNTADKRDPIRHRANGIEWFRFSEIAGAGGAASGGERHDSKTYQGIHEVGGVPVDLAQRCEQPDVCEHGFLERAKSSFDSAVRPGMCDADGPVLNVPPARTSQPLLNLGE